MLFQVDYDRFLKEIEVEKLKEGDRDSLELEDLGTSFAYYLSSLDRPKTFVFVVGKDEITDAQKINLNPKSRPAKRIIDDLQFRDISETLKRIEENMNKLPIRERIIEREVLKEE